MLLIEKGKKTVLFRKNNFSWTQGGSHHRDHVPYVTPETCTTYIHRHGSGPCFPLQIIINSCSVTITCQLPAFRERFPTHTGRYAGFAEMVHQAQNPHFWRKRHHPKFWQACWLYTMYHSFSIEVLLIYTGRDGISFRPRAAPKLAILYGRV